MFNLKADFESCTLEGLLMVKFVELVCFGFIEKLTMLLLLSKKEYSLEVT